MKKIIISTFCAIFLFSSFVSSSVTAEAIPAPTSPNEGAMGVGAAIIAGVLIVAGGGLALDETQEQRERIRQEAIKIYNQSSETFKDASMAAYNSALAAGKNSVTLTKDMVQELSGLSSLYEGSLNSILRSYEGETASLTDSNFAIVVSKPNSQTGRRLQMAANSAYELTVGGRIVETVDVGMWSSTATNIHFSGHWTTFPYLKTGTLADFGLTKAKYFEFRDEEGDWGLQTYRSLMLKYLGWVGSSYGLQKKVSDIPDGAISAGVSSAIGSIPTTGVNEYYVPIETFIPLTSYGDPLVYNPEAGTYAGSDGIPYTGVPRVTWDLPTVKTKEGLTLQNPGTTWDNVGTTTGNPVLVNEGDVPVEGDVPGTYTGVLQNILTGIGVISTQLTTGLVGSPSDVQWDKLKGIGTLFTTKFPFSLPWDAKNAMDAVFGNFAVKDKLTFDFEVDFNGKTYPFDLTIEKMFMDWFGFVRIAILILFDIGMIYAIRQWFGGAS